MPPWAVEATAACCSNAHPGWQLIGLDQDPLPAQQPASTWSVLVSACKLVASNFAAYTPAQPVLAVLADLGVSSHQLDVPERGFSFRADGPLDMRMNTEGGGETAAAADRPPGGKRPGRSALPLRRGRLSGGLRAGSRPRAPGMTASGAPQLWPMRLPAATPQTTPGASMPPPAASRPCGLP